MVTHDTVLAVDIATLGLGDACVKLGFANAEQVTECLREQGEAIERGERAPRLGELLVSRGYVSPEQVGQILTLQGQSILACQRCRVQFNVAARRPAAALLCPRCHHPLEETGRLESVAVVEELPIALPEDPLPAEVLRASRDASRRFGKYVLLKELGRGGSGVVDLAWDTFLGQRVALKRLRPDPDLPALPVWEARRILVEARSTIRLRHPSIVRIYDAGQIEQTHYISMEYVEGRSFDVQIDEAARAGRISPYHEDPAKTLTLLAGVARALAYAHSRPAPVIHCDLKPNNIMVDEEGQPRLLDFGLSRVLSAVPDGEREICGTPGYMAPEQARGATDAIDARTDVYGFGSLLYEALTGLAPFRGRPDVVLRAVLNETPLPPSEILRKLKENLPQAVFKPVPAFLEELCLRCLEKDQARRPASMLEIAELLERAARPAEPNPAFTATHVPGAAERRRARLRLLARRGGLVLAGLSLAAAALVAARPASPSTAPAIEAKDVEACLAAFQPDRALSLARLLPDGAGREDARGLLELRNAMEARLPLKVDTLSLRDAALMDVVLERDAGGRLRAGGRVVEWSDLEPSQILALARALKVVEEPAHRYALGLYCVKAGRRFDARGFFESLEGTALEGAGRRALEALRMTGAGPMIRG